MLLIEFSEYLDKSSYQKKKSFFSFLGSIGNTSFEIRPFKTDFFQQILVISSQTLNII